MRLYVYRLPTDFLQTPAQTGHLYYINVYLQVAYTSAVQNKINIANTRIKVFC